MTPAAAVPVERRLHIGVDYTAAVWQGAGIGRYTRELITAAAAQGGAYRYTLFYAAGGLDPRSPYLVELQRLCVDYPAIRARPIPLSPRRLTQIWQRLRLPLPIEWFTGPLDIVHAPDFVAPPSRARVLVTIHDLSFLIYPQFAAAGMVRYLRTAVPHALRRASVVLVDSEATRDDLVRLLGVRPARITVLYPGVNPSFRPLPPDVCEPVRHRLKLPEQFVLFVSTLSPRKNVVRLLEAFARLTDRPALALVLIGQPGWLYEEIFAAIERLQLGGRVLLPGFVDDKDLPALYNLARVSVYPSLYEGFGLPALEALACGTPLVTANNSSLPEVTADAAVLVDAQDVAAIADGMRKVLDDQMLRARLRTAGLARARAFTWERAAQHLLACYRRTPA